MSSAAVTFAAPASIRAVGPDRPWQWLAAGWHDMWRAPAVSLSYGLGVTAFSWLLFLLLVEYRSIHWLLPLTGGFFMVAPLIAIGLYDTSRRLGAGEPVGLWIALTAWRSPRQVALLGVALLLLHLIWVRVALLLYALFFGLAPGDLGRLVETTLLSGDAVPFLIVGSVVGLGFAIVAFAIAAVSLPMALDRDCDAITAMLTSIAVVRRNKGAMALWAALIAVFTMAGMAMGFLGLIITVPLVAHATWHAYRDMVE